MKKGLILMGAVVIFVMSASSSVFAYDGGGGFPPGYTGNPNPPQKLVCNFVVKQLPFGMSVWLPRCHVEKVTTSAALNRSIRERITELMSRIRTGHN